jgi:asparagine synthase (glutamine-hydrolysing)
MCGIAGAVAAPGGCPSAESLTAMGDAMAHRGPDDATVRLFGRAGFSFRRLSIIDVAGGAQPIANEDETCHVVLNGEIYNHDELRRDLESRGHRFRTRSDVEVVVHGYEEWGDDVVRRLRGMFAFAVWDERRERLLLGRDRLGKKPLVYHEGGGALSFASELAALMAPPGAPRRPDLAALHQYLTYQYVPAPLTGFAGVRKLPPAHILVFENGRATVSRYWQLSFAPPLAIAEAEAVAELRRLLRDAVQARLMSEVPLGAFLSGGLDSSAIVALMAEFGRVKTFSIGFEEEEWNEVKYARQVAERYGTDHHEFIVRPQAADILPTLVEHYGEPYADSSALPTFYLSRLTREHVTVALTGDGGDELFAGYDRYKLLPLFGAAARLSPARSVASALDEAGGRFWPTRARRLLRAISSSPEESYARTMSCFSPEQKRLLYSDFMRETVGDADAFRVLYDRYAESDAPDLLGRTLYADTMTYLPGDLLAKVDIATMAVGLEARAPLLDHPLVEFAARLPPSLKIHHGSGKHILRRAVEDLLPAEVLGRRKKGFGVPIARWFRGELKEMAGDVLFSKAAQQRPFFRPEAVRRLWDEHQQDRADLGQPLWALLTLELWCRRFLDGA